ncbi:MAG: helix-turn-helix domain-containing protein [Thermoguttaceae bacterium]
MSIVDCACGADGSPRLNLAAEQPLHRLAAVRRLQGVSRRAIARRLNVDVAEIRRQENERSDLPLSKLYEWQKALEVPVGELLVESEDTLSEPLMKRAQLVRLMKTALAIMEQAEQEPIHRMAQTLIDQLVEMMPELRGVSPWHAVGKRRRLDELGAAAQRGLSEEVFLDMND